MGDLNVTIPPQLPEPELLENPYYHLLDALPEAILLHQNGRVSGLNRAAEVLWGVPRERAVGRTILEVVRRHTLETLIQQGGTLELEINGKILHCYTATGALIIEDRSHHKQREHELREVMAVLSHEFRTPVAGILGILEALEYDIPREMQLNFVQQGLSEIRRLARLVEDMTIGFRVSPKREFKLGEVSRRVLRLLQSEMDSSGVSLLLTGEEVVVHADPDKLLQVLLNLFENAIRYGPRPSLVRLEVLDNPEDTLLRIIDQGDALSDYQHIFQAHQRGPKARGPGSGMGLYIIRTIVEGWGGKVWGAHETGVGNVFSVSLPKR